MEKEELVTMSTNTLVHDGVLRFIEILVESLRIAGYRAWLHIVNNIGKILTLIKDYANNALVVIFH